MVMIFLIMTKSHWVSPGGKGRHPGSKWVLPRVENPNSPFLSFASVRAFSSALPYFTFLFISMHHHSYLCLHLSLGTKSLLLFKIIGKRVQNDIFFPPPTSSTPYASYLLSPFIWNSLLDPQAGFPHYNVLQVPQLLPISVFSLLFLTLISIHSFTSRIEHLFAPLYFQIHILTLWCILFSLAYFPLTSWVREEIQAKRRLLKKQGACSLEKQIDHFWQLLPNHSSHAPLTTWQNFSSEI